MIMCRRNTIQPTRRNKLCYEDPQQICSLRFVEDVLLHDHSTTVYAIAREESRKLSKMSFFVEAGGLAEHCGMCQEGEILA